MTYNHDELAAATQQLPRQDTIGVLTRKPQETDEHRYARHSRNATVLIAVIVSFWTVISIIGGIYGYVQISNAVNSFGNSFNSSTSTSCDITNPNWPNC